MACLWLLEKLVFLRNFGSNSWQVVCTRVSIYCSYSCCTKIAYYMAQDAVMGVGGS